MTSYVVTYGGVSADMSRPVGNVVELSIHKQSSGIVTCIYASIIYSIEFLFKWKGYKYDISYIINLFTSCYNGQGKHIKCYIL